MPYSPVPYTDQASVVRLLRTSNNKIRIGTAEGELSPTDIAGFILDASRYIDGFVRAEIMFDNLPIPNYQEKPEIVFSAQLLAAYFIVRAMYYSYRQDQLGVGVVGWMKDATEQLQLFKQHLNEGVYTDLSPASGGMRFITAEQFFQTQIGINGVGTVVNDQVNTVPIKNGNIGPYEDGGLND